MTPKLFQIFRAGTFTSMQGAPLTFSESDLQGMTAAFDSQRRPAPLVLGHPENDQPAYGQVTGLFVKLGVLYAQAMVEDALLALVQAKRYARVSASFIAPFSEGNPARGAYYLKHVGFLGALPPAVRGLEPPSFAERGNVLSFSESKAIVMPNAAVPVRGINYDAERLVWHNLASEYREVCPALSYSEAVTLAQDALTF
ncbi:hypothetical protein ACJBUE_22965 (plasmid) [Ralstonia syzygii subsp. celebesensis]|uniref:hypothetical protein n=1 Tax=Ralstonia syzygii TaxID=28097 RepID=UPI00387E0FFF